MSLYVISDLHLSKSADKPMDIFGFRWQHYMEKLEKNWRSVVKEEDTVVIPGDISWEMKLEQTEADFAFLHSLPGTKIVGKGNHDLWWQSMKKMNEFVSAKEFHTIKFLFNNCFETKRYFICGSRGWWTDSTSEAMPSGVDFEKVVSREVGRLRVSLEEAFAKNKGATAKKEILAFLHFPVSFAGKEIRAFSDVLNTYGVKRCYFGHIHGVYDSPSSFEHEGISYQIVSADYLNFVPLLIDRDDFYEGN